MLPKGFQLITPFIKEPWKGFTLKEIKTRLNNKSDSFVHSRLKKFVEAGILKEESVGNNIVYQLELKSMKTQAYCGFLAEYKAWNQADIPYKDLQKISRRIPATYYTLLITGSYANKKQKTTSDIDIVIIVEGIETKKVYSELKFSCETNIPQIHLYVFTATEFKIMLTNQEANFGKEAAKNNLILYGGENYFKLINEAIEHGCKESFGK